MKEEKTPEVKHSEVVPAPKKDTAKMVWMIIAIIAIIALIGLGIYGYVKMRDLNNQIKAQQTEISNLQNTKKTLEDAASVAAAAAAKSAVNTATNANKLTVPELGFSFTANPTLLGLSYVNNKSNNSAQFSTSPIMSSLYNISNGKGIDWLPGYLLSVVVIKKSEANNINKENIIKDLGSSYLVNIPEQNGPFSEPGFEQYAQLVKQQRPVLLDSLKSAQVSN